MSKKLVFIFIVILLSISSKAQVNTLEEARSLAKKENKLIFIRFSGSDWCGPCIAFKRDIVDTPNFEDYAKEKLILLTADFPRQKKNQLSKEQQAQNDKLAEMYNPNGSFPYLVLVDAEGNVLRKWGGYDKKLTVEDYIEEINHFIK